VPGASLGDAAGLAAGARPLPLSGGAMGSSRYGEDALYWAIPAQIRQRPQKRLGDLVVLGQPVKIRCSKCAHQRVMSPAELAVNAGYDAELPAVERRMRCRACGSREVRLKAVERGSR